MKRTLRLLSAVLILTCGSTMAQGNAKKKIISPAQHRSKAIEVNAGSKTASTPCGSDIIDYVYYKEEIAGNNIFEYLPVWPTELASTAFPNAEKLTISSLMFYGRLNPGGSSSAKATLGIWTVEQGTYKPLNLITSAKVTITTSLQNYTVALTTPITLSDTFAITLENETFLDTIDVVISDPNSTNTQELLSWYDYQGFWETMPEVNGIEAEFVFMPVVSYDLKADFTANSNSICVTTPVTFTNSSSSVFENRVFNIHAFNHHWVDPAVDLTYAWDFGDGSAIVYQKNPSHTYTTAGTYTVSLTGNIRGYTTSGGSILTCSDTKTLTVDIKTAVQPTFDVDSTQKPLITFTNTTQTSETSMLYSWDFGDGGTTTVFNPSHVFAPGTHTVTLTATGPCGTSASSKTLTIKDISTGIAQLHNTIQIDTRHDQLNNQLTVTLSSLPTSGGMVSVYNLQGKVIVSERITSLSNAISLGDIAAGSYIVRVQTQNAAGSTRIAVIR
jgi:PKD repeat protein